MNAAGSDLSLPPILRLSNEILTCIAEYVTEGARRVRMLESLLEYHPFWLLNLALVSRRFHHLVEPLLYTHYRSKACFDNTSLDHFISRLLSRPDLARRVKIFEQNVDSSFNEECLSIFQGHALIEAARDSLNGLDIGSLEVLAWYSGIQDGLFDPMVALALTLMPNLEELRLENFDNFDSSPRVGWVIQQSSTRGYLRHLRHVSLNSMCSSYVDTSVLFEFLKVAPLYSFDTGPVVEDGASEADDEFQPEWLKTSPQFNTKELIFEDSCIDDRTFCKFLQCFPRLEKLHYNVGEETMFCTNEPPEFMKVILHLKSTLCHLTVLNLNYQNAALMAKYPIGNLSEFEKLTHIEAASYFLIGEPDTKPVVNQTFPTTQSLVEVLPPCLQYLCIDHCTAATVPQLFALLSAISSFPALNTLDLGWGFFEVLGVPCWPGSPGPHAYPGFTKEEAFNFLDVCVQAGVKVVITPCLPEPKDVFWTEDHPREIGGSAMYPFESTRRFVWPYEGYGELCAEHGLDPETGRQPDAIPD